MSPAFRIQGRVLQLTGNLIEVAGLKATLGEICRITLSGDNGEILAEVVGFDNMRLKLSPLTSMAGISPGDLVEPHSRLSSLAVGPALLGRVIDGLGQPIDGLGPISFQKTMPLAGRVSNPLNRPVIQEQLDVGVRCINALLPLGKGQRMGIFAGSGVGKSTLLGMMARYTTASVNVIALIGERGREVNEFLKHDLGEEGLRHSVVVVATSDQPATVRVRAALMAAAAAEYFKDSGKDVLLMMDSVTRFAMAAREIGLAAGEPPTTKGYTPSVFSLLPALLERAGNFQEASITGIYTVLVEGDDLEEPVADALRSILDGHIVLDRNLAQTGHYPAIDVLKSVSRLKDRLLDAPRRNLASRFVETLSNYRKSEDMIRIGAYARGSHPPTDYAIDMIDKLNAFLQQPVDDPCTVGEASAALEALFQS
ncbi:MAG: FliI/YscN family ATPase [Deltaproteobacteria bacterium]|nr:FliI/YscN family ATPase [Deltaproteobacteria bacterium]